MKKKDYDSIVYMRSIQLEVTIPEKHVWEFMALFGKTFSLHDSFAGGDNVREVKRYYNHQAGWHVIVTVAENEEDNFYQFLYAFSIEKKFEFRLPEESDFTPNFLAYNKLRLNTKWVQKNKGKWVIIINGVMVASENTIEDAMKQAYIKYGKCYQFITKVNSVKEDLTYHIYKRDE